MNQRLVFEFVNPPPQESLIGGHHALTQSTADASDRKAKGKQHAPE
ncbi:MAG: hypothetical protein Q8S33_09420 [Myxococcales bacterium]|nr:hypothetical protein [Myxococcales bacterium]